MQAALYLALSILVGVLAYFIGFLAGARAQRLYDYRRWCRWREIQSRWSEFYDEHP